MTRRNSLNQYLLKYYSYIVVVILCIRVLTENFGVGPLVSILLYGISLPVLFKVYKLNKYVFINVLIIGSIILYGFFNIYGSSDGSFSSARAIIRYLSYFIVFLIFYKVPIKLSLIMRVYGILLIVQFIAWSYQSIIGVDRPSGTMYSRNHIGYFIIPYLYLSLLYYEDKFKPALSVFYSFMLGGLGAIVAIISSFTKYLLDRSLVKTLKMSIIIIPIFVLMTYLFLSHRIVEQVESFGEIPDRVENFDSGHSGSFTWRVVTWYYLINEVIDHDAYIFGMGLDTTSTGANLFGLEPHNDYVKVFTEFGLVGLTLFLLMIFHHLKFQIGRA